MNAGNAVSLVVDTVEACGRKITDGKKKAAIGNYAAKLIDNGATDDELRAWATHYGQRLGAGARIRPSQAWDDVSGAGSVSATALAGVPANKDRARERRSEGYEWLGEKMTPSQDAMLARVLELSRQGKSSAEIVAEVLGPREAQDEGEAA